MNDPQTAPPARWETKGERTLLTTRVFDVRGVRRRHPARSTEREFIVVDAPDWCNVVALTPDGRLVLVRQFRQGSDDSSLEVPGGVIERGEEPANAAVRELREETGFTGAPARSLGWVHPNPAIQSNKCHLIFVDAATRTAALEWDADEEIEIVTAPVTEVLEWARTGCITHALTLNALFLFEPIWNARPTSR